MSEDNIGEAAAPQGEMITPSTAGDSSAQTMTDLLTSGAEIRVLKPGDMVEGTIISVTKNEVYLNLAGSWP